MREHACKVSTIGFGVGYQDTWVCGGIIPLQIHGTPVGHSKTPAACSGRDRQAKKLLVCKAVSLPKGGRFILVKLMLSVVQVQVMITLDLSPVLSDTNKIYHNFLRCGRKVANGGNRVMA